MKRFLKIGLMMASAVLLLSSCNCFNRMVRHMDGIKATSNPEVLSLRGNSVPADVTITFPARYFQRRATMRITPVLVFEGGQINGTPKYFQGERVSDNYTAISFRNGGSYTQSVSFPWDPRANLATLELRMEARCKNGEFRTIGSMEIAKGVSTIQLLANNAAFMTIMPDNFKRVTSDAKDAQIMYLINRSEVRPAELTKEQIKMFEAFVRENAAKERANLNNIAAKGFASPDGPVDFNDRLSADRSKTGQSAIAKNLSDVNVKYDISSYGEDWDGFQELVAASNIKDRDLILQVLSMYSSPVKRDQEIRNMSSVFEVLARDILPQLRRTKLIANVDIEGRTDAELRAASTGNLNDLSNEELLFAATLTNDANLQARLYQTAATKFNCPRGYNNLGVVLARQGKLTEAQAAFDKSASISRSADITNNQGALALMKGDVASARRLLSSLNTPDSRANMGLVNLAEGNYAEAARTLTGYNLAVAEVLNSNYGRAKTLLANDNSAQANYLKAVIAMREGNTSAAESNLKNAFAMDPSLKAKAQKDVEFAKIFGSTVFLSLQ